MAASKKTKVAFKHVIGAFTGERLEAKKPPQKVTSKRSTSEVIFGKAPPQQEEMNPFVEAMLQTQESEKKSAKQTSTRIDREIDYYHKQREKEARRWREEQDARMARKQKEDSGGIPLPSTAPKGPGPQKPGQKKGMEQVRKKG